MLVTLQLHTVPLCRIQAPYFSALLSAPEADLSGTYVSQVPLLSGSFLLLLLLEYSSFIVLFLLYGKSESVIHVCMYVCIYIYRLPWWLRG